MNHKKLRYGSVSVALSAIVIAAVILLNVGVGALFSSQLWRLDETSERIYTLDQSYRDFLKLEFDKANANRAQEGEEAVSVDIIFCNDPDQLTANSATRYVYYTALALQKAFPETIRVTATNIWNNPSIVAPYKTNSYSNIYQSNVIIASGSEFRVTSIEYYYVSDTESGETWAYQGERKMVQAITAVTRVEAPLCGITVNHGEPFATEEGRVKYQRFLQIVEDAGYDVIYLDLAKDEIPLKKCRLIVTFDPQTDFLAEYGSENSVSEIAKLDKFMEVKADEFMKTETNDFVEEDTAGSFLVFVNADTPELPNLEMFLKEWGIAFNRYADPADAETVIGNYQVNSSLSVDSLGSYVIGQYETAGKGAGITENMRKYGGSPKVVFGNAMPISYSKLYEPSYRLPDEETGTEGCSYASYFKNNHSREIFDVFRADQDAVANALQNGTPILNENGEAVVDTYGNYKLMTMTVENRNRGEGQGYTQVNFASYVGAFGSTDFASDSLLGSSSYANTDLLLATLRMMGREVVPVGLLFEPLYDSAINEYNSTTQQNYITEAGKTAWTVVLTLLPLAAAVTTGCVVLIRRRHGR